MTSFLFAVGERLPSCDKRLVNLYRHWLGIRPAANLLPGRCHLAPSAIPALLPWIWLTEVHRSPLRFKHRLIGTEIVNLMQCDPTGRWYDEIRPDFRISHTFHLFKAGVEDRKISLYHGSPTFTLDGGEWKTIESLTLPLAQNGRDVDMLLGITISNPTAGG